MLAPTPSVHAFGRSGNFFTHLHELALLTVAEKGSKAGLEELFWIWGESCSGYLWAETMTGSVGLGTLLMAFSPNLPHPVVSSHTVDSEAEWLWEVEETDRKEVGY